MKDLSEAIINSKKSSIRKLFELVLEAKDAISFGIGQPNFGPPKVVKDSIIQAIEEGKSQYAPTLGLPGLRNAIAKKFREENNIKWIQPENVIVTNGGSQALQLSYACLTNPGDEILLSSPNFLSYYYLASFYGLKCIEIPRNDDFSPNISLMKENIIDKTKFIIINSPNNPTGYVYSKKDMDDIVKLVLDNNLYLISDEVYEQFVYEDVKHVSPASYSGMENRTLTLNAMSKTFGAPGYRLGFIGAPKIIIDLMEKYAQYTAAGVNHPTQLGAIKAMEEGNLEFPNILDSYDKKRKLCVKRLTEMNFKVNEPKGAFYIMPSIENFKIKENSSEFSQKLMKETEVAVVPGDGFGSYSDNYIRISYATDDKKLEEGFNRIEKFLKNNNYI